MTLTEKQSAVYSRSQNLNRCLATLKKLARVSKVGPAPHRRVVWIGKLLDLAQEARDALAALEAK